MLSNNNSSVNIDELKIVLKHLVTNNQFLQSSGKIPKAIEVVGESGIGKTSAMLQLGKELNLPIVKINLTQIEELGDLVGFPVKESQMVKGEDDVWIEESYIQHYLNDGYVPSNNKRMAYAPPSWISSAMEGGILLLDDWNRADMRFIQAVMELIDRQSYISWSLPKNWHIILTANPDDKGYIVNSIDQAQKTRFISLNLNFDINCWAEWAESEGLDSRCINFLLLHPELMEGEVNSRSVSMFFDSISSIKVFSDELNLISLIGNGCVGEEFSTLFTLFINNKLDKIISPEKILSLDKVHVNGILKSIIGSGDDYRADLSSTIALRMINYIKYNDVDSMNVIDRLVYILEDDIFTTDISFNIVKTIFNNDKKKYNKMTLNPSLVKYILS